MPIHKRGRRQYTPPPVPLLLREMVTWCKSCEQATHVAVIGDDAAQIGLCANCLLAYAEALTGIRWLNNWRTIQTTRRVRNQIAAEKLAAGE